MQHEPDFDPDFIIRPDVANNLIKAWDRSALSEVWVPNYRDVKESWAPSGGDKRVVLRTQSSCVPLEVWSVLQGSSTPQVTWDLKYGPDITGAGSTSISTGEVTTSTTTGNQGILLVDNVPAGNYVWIDIVAVTGTVTDFALTLGYRLG